MRCALLRWARGSDRSPQVFDGPCALRELLPYAAARNFARSSQSAYDFGAVTITRHVFWIALVSAGCASRMSSLREDNRRLSQSVTELRADRRSQDRKIRDLEQQLAMIKEKQVSAEPVPVLPVEV